jgi:hypothetical protein
MIHITPASLEDAFAIAPRLRQADKDELFAVTGQTNPDIVLQDAFEMSDRVWIIKSDGEPVAIFGVVTHEQDNTVGIPWMVGTDEIAENGIAILRSSRPWISKLLTNFSHLINYVDARNELHIKWLKWCGFTFTHLEQQYGYERRPFWRFEKMRQMPT